MEQVHKAFVLLSAAVTMSALGTAAAEAASKKAPGKGKQVKKARKGKKGKVKRVRRARKRPGEFRPDLGMPAGTLYDVISHEDL